MTSSIDIVKTFGDFYVAVNKNAEYVIIEKCGCKHNIRDILKKLYDDNDDIPDNATDGVYGDSCNRAQFNRKLRRYYKNNSELIPCFRCYDKNSNSYYKCVTCDTLTLYSVIEPGNPLTLYSIIETCNQCVICFLRSHIEDYDIKIAKMRILSSCPLSHYIAHYTGCYWCDYGFKTWGSHHEIIVCIKCNEDFRDDDAIYNTSDICIRCYSKDDKNYKKLVLIEAAKILDKFNVIKDLRNIIGQY